MSKYVLGESAARKLRAMFNGTMRAGRIESSNVRMFDDSDFLPPFTVRWAASLADAGSETPTGGEWIIWLPGDTHVVIGTSSVDLSEELEEAGGDYPEGWFKLGDALDRDEGGTLYLNVNVESKTAELSDDESTGLVSVKVADAVVGDDGARAVKGFVRSVVVLDGSSGSYGSQYDGDDHSITRYANLDPDPTQMWKDNYFHVYGFGRFTPHGRTNPIGTYISPSDLTLKDGETTNLSFMCRTGNSSSPDMNFISYKRLKIELFPSPFKYTETTYEDPNTHQIVTKHEIVKCMFYFAGGLVSLDDFDVSSIVQDGSVYLIGTKERSGKSSSVSKWNWKIGTEEGAAPSGGSVLNLKLYDFKNGKVETDYRTTFLNVAAPLKADGSSIEDVDALRLSHFADTDMDSTKGLVSRLKANVKTGEITAEEDSIMLLCRKDGKLIYVPLTGKSGGSDPEGEEGGNDPCDHPGSGSSGGVPADDSSGGGESDPYEMGVPAEGDSHPGRPCTDCDCD